MTASRETVRTVEGVATSDGAGVRLNRIIGGRALQQLDPFLLLDEFRSDNPGDYIAGFPEHPHRGFETVTYMLAGRMRHRDNQGNEGQLRAGSIQWMTAGRGIVHSEMPEQENGLMWGFQLWVNLPAADKMTAPRYQDIEPEAVPLVTTGSGAKVRVLAGQFGGATGPVSGIPTEPLYLDIELARGDQDLEVPVSRAHTAFVYVFDGVVHIGGKRTETGRGQLAVLGEGEIVRVSSADGGRLILVTGRPLGEPVARYGPFVMNTEQEIRQALADYQAGRF